MSPSVKSHHSLEREPPLALYIGMNIQTATRSKKLITQLYDLGLNVSYDRVLQLESQLTTAGCENFQNKGVVVPAQFRCRLFTVGEELFAFLSNKIATLDCPEDK